jgi:hypothetical protein
MKSLAWRINMIFTLMACLCLGCNTSKTSAPNEKEKDASKQATLMRFHIEANPDPTGRTIDAPIYRARPVHLTVQREPVLDEGFMEKVELVDADEMGGHALKITFDKLGTRRLDALTVEHRSQHLAVHAQWTENRWLAAPVLNKRISNGELIFTPDATREETERIVRGLSNVVKRLHQKYTF